MRRLQRTQSAAVKWAASVFLASTIYSPGCSRPDSSTTLPVSEQATAESPKAEPQKSTAQLRRKLVAAESTGEIGTICEAAGELADSEATDPATATKAWHTCFKASVHHGMAGESALAAAFGQRPARVTAKSFPQDEGIVTHYVQIFSDERFRPSAKAAMLKGAHIRTRHAKSPYGDLKLVTVTFPDNIVEDCTIDSRAFLELLPGQWFEVAQFTTVCAHSVEFAADVDKDGAPEVNVVDPDEVEGNTRHSVVKIIPSSKTLDMKTTAKRTTSDLEQSCAAKDAKSCFELGIKVGAGDLARAKELVSKSCDLGYQEACDFLPDIADPD